PTTHIYTLSLHDALPIYQDADFRQRDYGTATYQGSSTWTLDQFWATGHSRCVDVSRAAGFSMGNNGQAGAVNTGLYWYYAGVQIDRKSTRLNSSHVSISY